MSATGSGASDLDDPGQVGDVLATRPPTLTRRSSRITAAVILSSGGTTGIRTTIIHTATAGKTTVTTRTATAMITVTTVMITASTAIGTGPGSGASSTGCSYRTATTPETQSTTPWRPATRESGHSKSVC